MSETFNFITEEGEQDNRDVLVYALSTCGFCRSALNFLRKNNIHFKYIYVDKQSQDIKKEIMDHLRTEYEGKFEKIGFPFCILDDGEEIIVGFTEEKWKKALLD